MFVETFHSGNDLVIAVAFSGDAEPDVSVFADDVQDRQPMPGADFEISLS
jgi:hypothetical protein